jgi:hypothetical protein
MGAMPIFENSPLNQENLTKQQETEGVSFSSGQVPQRGMNYSPETC